MKQNDYLIAMGGRISACRKDKRLTQEQLAERIGVSLQTVSNIECGKKAARPENIAKICNALDSTADYILLGKRSESQMKNIVKSLTTLTDREYKVIEELVELLKIGTG